MIAKKENVEQSSVEYSTAAGVASILINRPAKKNALTFQMLADLCLALDEASADSDVHVVVLRGAGGCFCAGIDLRDLSETPRGDGGLRDQIEKRWWIARDCSKPVIAVVDGAAVGFGAELAAQCDIRIASERASFGWVFAARGLLPDTGAGSWLLPKIVGLSKAFEWLYTGKTIAAEEALSSGLVSSIHSVETLEESVDSLISAMMTGSPFAHRQLKQLVYQGLSSTEAEHRSNHTKAMVRCFESEDHREGVQAFLEKRAPRFSGK